MASPRSQPPVFTMVGVNWRRQDMFFAAVEMRENPSLRGKPVAVGGMAMISTANYEARTYVSSWLVLWLRIFLVNCPRVALQVRRPFGHAGLHCSEAVSPLGVCWALARVGTPPPAATADSTYGSGCGHCNVTSKSLLSECDACRDARIL